MTDGSSQGLFVIVAVVIFGIFVVISYLLFRDKLQTGLASIFDDSIIQSTNSLNKYKSILDMTLFKPRRLAQSEYNENFKVSEGSIRIETNKANINSSSFGAMYGNYTTFKSNTKYILRFKMKDFENLKTISGHEVYLSTTNYVKINGKEVKNMTSENTGWTYPYNLTDVGAINGEYTVEYSFTTMDLTKFVEEKNNFTSLFILPNRGYDDGYKVTIYNLELYEVEK